MNLIVILGPTAVGKTELALKLAETLGSPILNCDSRQLYRGLQIGTASPTQKQLQRVHHYFVGTLGLDEYYSAARYEQDVLTLVKQLSPKHKNLVLTGGSMMYIDAVCHGIDDIPTVRNNIRNTIKQRLTEEGLPALFTELKRLDPDYAAIVDPKNTRRVVHALEICVQTGRTYTSFRKKATTKYTDASDSLNCTSKKRPFNTIKIGLNRPRAELFARINQRVDQMIDDGLLNEVRHLLPYRGQNALNTVGYKELFQVIDGECELDYAIEKIKKNTRDYAKKQLTWFKRDESIHWFHPDDENAIRTFINAHT